MTEAASHIVLFNDERYQRLNLRTGQRPFRYDHVVAGRLIGTLSGVVEGGLLDCGHSAPLGGIDFVRRRETVGNIAELLRSAIAHARDQGIREIRVRARPAYYGANESACEFVLHNLGGVVESCELSLGLEVWRFLAPEQYIASLDCEPRRMVRQGDRAGFSIRPALTTADWQASYTLLAETKRRRGAEFKISLDYVMRLRDLFGARIVMHQVTLGDGLSAAALVYRIAPEWDCLVAWGDDLSYRGKGAMNMISYHLVATAIAQSVRLIDIGISSVGGVPDAGLIQFKRSLGATTGLRIDFRLPVSQR